jgi:hypothetical protein
MKRRKKIILGILAGIVLLIGGVGYYYYSNLNRLLSDALLKSFNSNIISDVYELKFETLKVDIFQGSIRIKNVSVLPREQPLGSYPYINSSFSLRTKSLKLLNVELMTLINDNKLVLEKVIIEEPEVDLLLDGDVRLFFPLKDTSLVQKNKSNKKFVDYFALTEFRLTHASFHAVDNYNGGKFTIKDFNIDLADLVINQKTAHDEYFYKSFIMNIGEVAGHLNKGPFSSVFFKDFHLKVDSFKVDKTVDTLLYKFYDCNLAMYGLDLNTADSVLHIQMNSFGLTYKDSTILMGGIIVKPNYTFAEMQKHYKFQKTDVSVSVGSMKLSSINFDDLSRKKVFAGKLMLDSVDASIYKDNTKLVDPEHLPGYPGPQIASIPVPVKIDEVDVSQLHLESIEIKRDGIPAKVNLNRGTVHATGITNLKPDDELAVDIEAFIEDKVKFEVQLGFSYKEPQIKLKGHFGRFNLLDINKLIAAYTPAKIDSGIADDISFTGVITRTQSSGTMKFLYHGLVVDLHLKDKAKWKSDVIAFAANEYLNENNPAREGDPPKVVKYTVQRDMHKGFVNIIIKSALAGLKETMILTGENKKAHKAKKKAMKEKEKKGQ